MSYDRRGDYQSAISTFQKANSIATETQNTELMRNTLTLLGTSLNHAEKVIGNFSEFFLNFFLYFS